MRVASLLLSCALMPSAVPAQSYDFSAVDAHFQNNIGVWTSFAGFPQLYVEVRRSGETIYTYSAGGFQRDTVRPLASATKWISGAVVLKAAEDGTIALDERIGDTFLLYETNGKGDLTPLDGFSMRSGFITAQDTDPQYETQNIYTLQQSAVLIARNIPVSFPIGGQLAYDGAGMQAVGYLVQSKGGSPWEDIAADSVLDPLGMTSTTYTTFAPNPAIAGGIEASPADYLRFLDMVIQDGEYGGEQILSAESVDRMFTNYTDDLPVYATPWNPDLPLPDGETSPDYGFGAWVLRENASGEVVELTSPGAFGTFPWADRERGLTAVIFAYTVGGETWEADLIALELIREAVDARDSALGDLWVF